MAYSFRDYLQPTKKLNVAGQAGSKKGVACNFIWLYYTNVGAWAFNLTSVVVARNYLASGWQLVNHDSLAALPFPQLLQLPYPTSCFASIPSLNWISRCVFIYFLPGALKIVPLVHPLHFASSTKSLSLPFTLGSGTSCFWSQTPSFSCFYLAINVSWETVDRVIHLPGGDYCGLAVAESFPRLPCQLCALLLPPLPLPLPPLLFLFPLPDRRYSSTSTSTCTSSFSSSSSSFFHVLFTDPAEAARWPRLTFPEHISWDFSR